MKKITALSLVVFLHVFSVNFVFAESKPEKDIAKVRAKIQKLGTGPDAKIEVKQNDGLKVSGYILESAQEHFMVMNEKTGVPVSVSYSKVKQAQGSNRSRNVIITVTVIVLGILLLIFAGKS